MKYIIWIREREEHTNNLGPWIENGDGPMSKATAERVERELRADFHLPVRALPVGCEPLTLNRS
jgi:hypothetical protein